jgi:hypothetical protein
MVFGLAREAEEEEEEQQQQPAVAALQYFLQQKVTTCHIMALLRLNDIYKNDECSTY